MSRTEQRPDRSDCARIEPILPEYVVGVLDLDEARHVLRHVERCPACAEAARNLRDEMSVLTEAYLEEPPPPGLWGKVEARVDEERAKVAAEADALVARLLPNGSTLLRAASGGWRDTSVPGVRVRVLHEDPAQDKRTALYQMDPGSQYPAHVHGGAEECFVLSGDLWLGDLKMGPGDYQRVEGESRHLVQSTRGGCLLYISCSMSDRLELE